MTGAFDEAAAGKSPSEFRSARPTATGLRDPAFWEDRLVTFLRDAGGNIEGWETEAQRFKRIPLIGGAVQPAEQFFNSILSGRVERQRFYCDHIGIGTDLMLLIRMAKTWHLACVEHTKAATIGYDSRCDWCGEPTGDRAPVITIDLRRLRILAQFCDTHLALIDPDIRVPA